MTGIELTERGRHLALALSVSISLALLFRDYPSAILSSAFAIIISWDLFDARRSRSVARNFVRFEPEKFEARLLRGETATCGIRVQAARESEVETPNINGLRIEPRVLVKGENEVSMFFNPNLVGEYKASGIAIRICSRLKLFSILDTAPFEVDAKVYPRLLAAMAEAIEFLMRRGRGSEGEEPTSLKGAGLEYAGTRQYMAGDSLRHIDWKATARHAELMVREFYREGGASVHVIYDVEAPGPATHDELATGFVNLLLSVARRGSPLGVIFYESEASFLEIAYPNPVDVLAASLKHLFHYNKMRLEDLFSVLDIVPGHRTWETLAEIFDDETKTFFEKDLLSMRYGKGGLVRRVQGFALDGANNQVMFVTSLIANTRLILELVEEAARSSQVSVAYYSKPWVDSPGLEEAYAMKRRLDKALNTITRKRGQTIRLAAGTAQLGASPPLLAGQ